MVIDTYIYYASATALSLCFVLTFAKLALKKISAEISATIFIGGLFLFNLINYLVTNEGFSLELIKNNLLIIFIEGSLLTLGIYFLAIAIKRSNVLTILPITMLGVVTSIILRLIITSAGWGPLVIISSVLVVLGLILMLIANKNNLSLGPVIYGIIGSIALGVYMITPNNLTVDINGIIGWASLCLAFIFMWIILIIRRQGKEFKKVTILHFLYIVICDALIFFAIYFRVKCIALNVGNIPNIIATVSFVGTIIVARLINKEKTKPITIIGAMTIFIALLLYCI